MGRGHGSTDVADFEPDLLVTDVADGLDFWCRLYGFEIAYDRTVDGFAYVAGGRSHIMLEQHRVGRNWSADKLEPPVGRGVNFQIGVSGEPLGRGRGQTAHHGGP